MADIKIDFDDRGLAKELNTAPGRIRQEVKTFLNKEGQRAWRLMTWRVSGTSQSKSRRRVRVRSGLLRASLGFNVTRRAGTTRLKFGVIKRKGAALKYAKVHEEGMTIQPKDAVSFLTIPVGQALTKAGVARFTMPEAMNKFGKKDTALLPTKKGGWIFGRLLKRKRTIVDKSTGRNRKVREFRPLFVLVKKVRIPKRPFFQPVAKETTRRLGEFLPGVVRQAILSQQSGKRSA